MELVNKEGTWRVRSAYLSGVCVELIGDLPVCVFLRSVSGLIDRNWVDRLFSVGGMEYIYLQLVPHLREPVFFFRYYFYILYEI